MQVGWDEKTDTYFINGLTHREAGHLNGLCQSLQILEEEFQETCRLYNVAKLDTNLPQETNSLGLTISNLLEKAKSVRTKTKG